jgi:diguanylate cyclase (GGDEF)-like protein
LSSLSITSEQYRLHYLNADIAQWRFAIALFALSNIAFTWFDFKLFGWSSKFQLMLAVRFVHVAYSVWFWHRLQSIEQVAQADRLMMVWCALGMIVILANALGRPQDYYGHYVFEVFALLVFFAAVPLPPHKQLLAVAVYFPVTMIMLYWYKQPPIPLYTSNVSFIVLLTIVSGYLISVRIHRYRLLALEARIELEKQVATDPLTGIANRRAFMDWARSELARVERKQHPVSLMMLDIDHFKAVNDHYGHDTGDALLIAFAQRVALELRPYDHFARLGGEEFVIALPDCPLENAASIAYRINDRVRNQDFELGTQVVSTTLSIGVTQIDPEDPSISAALKRADTALYVAKGKGRDRVEVSE